MPALTVSALQPEVRGKAEPRWRRTMFWHRPFEGALRAPPQGEGEGEGLGCETVLMKIGVCLPSQSPPFSLRC